MNETLAQVTPRKSLTHAALDEDCNRDATTNNTHPQDSAALWFEGGLSPSTGRCAALTLDQSRDCVLNVGSKEANYTLYTTH